MWRFSNILRGCPQQKYTVRNVVVTKVSLEMPSPHPANLFSEVCFPFDLYIANILEKSQCLICLIMAINLSHPPILPLHLVFFYLALVFSKVVW